VYIAALTNIVSMSGVQLSPLETEKILVLFSICQLCFWPSFAEIVN